MGKWLEQGPQLVSTTPDPFLRRSLPSLPCVTHVSTGSALKIPDVSSNYVPARTEMTVAMFTLPAAPGPCGRWNLVLSGSPSVPVPMPSDTPMPKLDFSRCREAPQCRWDVSSWPKSGLIVGISPGGGVREAPGEERGTRRERQRELFCDCAEGREELRFKKYFICCKLQ